MYVLKHNIIGLRRRIDVLVGKRFDKDFPPSITDLLIRTYLPVDEL